MKNDFISQLNTIRACKEAITWVDERDFSTAWNECERADWMLWLVGKMQDKEGWPTRQQIVLVACDCAELVLPIYEKKYPNDKRVRDCIEVTRKWANGEATTEEVRKARADASDAAAASAANAAAAYAADAAADAAAASATYASATYAADAAAASATYASATYAADAAADAAAASAYAADAAAASATYAAGTSIQKKCANICRKHLKVPMIFRVI